MKNEKLVMDYDSGDYDSSEDDEGEDNDEEEEELVGLSDEDEDEDEDGEKENGESKFPDELKNPPTVLAELNIEDYEDDDDFLQEGEKEKDDKRERKNYKKPGKTDSQWIESFMTNNNYDIIDKSERVTVFFMLSEMLLKQ